MAYIAFGSIGNYGWIDNNAYINIANTFTVESSILFSSTLPNSKYYYVFEKLSGGVNGYNVSLYKDTAGAHKLYVEYKTSTDATIKFITYNIPASINPFDDLWHGIAIKRSGTYLYGLVDGQNCTVYSGNNNIGSGNFTSTSKFSIGPLGGSGYTPTLCKYDNVRIWNIALSDAIILANLTNPPTTNINLMANWRFNEGSGNTTADMSGNGNTMTLYNSVVWYAETTSVITSAFVQPATNQYYSSNTIPIEASVTCSIPGRRLRVYYKIDSGSYVQLGDDIYSPSGTSVNSDIINYDISGLSASSHTISIYSEDMDSGDDSLPAITRIFTIDNTAPTSSAPTLTAINTTSIKIHFNATASGAPLDSSPYLLNKNNVDIGSWRSADGNGDVYDSGLSVNTQYTYKYKARDTAGNVSDYSVTSSKYTLCNTPENLASSNITSNSVTLSWTNGNNPSGTTYRVKVRRLGIETQIYSGTNTTTMHAGLFDGFVYEYKVSAINGDGIESAYTDWLRTVTTNVVPTATAVSIQGSAAYDTVLTGVYTYNDSSPEDTSPTGTQYKWYRSNDSDGYDIIDGAINTTYTLTINDVGRTIKFEVTPKQQIEDGGITMPAGLPVMSSYIGPVVYEPAVPVAGQVTIVAGDHYIGTTITGTYVYSDQNSDIENGTIFKWYRGTTSNGPWTQITTGVTNAITFENLSYQLQAADKNKFIRLGITPKNSITPETGIEVFSASTPEINYAEAPPVASNVSISIQENLAYVGHTLTALYEYTDLNDDLEASTIFKWFRADTADGEYTQIPGAGNSTYVLQPSDYNKFIKVEVTPVSL